MSDTFARVRKLVAQQWVLEEAEVTPETAFKELNSDSLEMAEFMMALEEEFRIEIPDDIGDVQTVADVVQYLERKTAT